MRHAPSTDAENRSALPTTVTVVERGEGVGIKEQSVIAYQGISSILLVSASAKLVGSMGAAVGAVAQDRNSTR